MSWVGPDVSGIDRARVSMHRSDVQNHFKPVVNFDIQVLTKRPGPSCIDAMAAQTV